MYCSRFLLFNLTPMKEEISVEKFPLPLSIKILEIAALALQLYTLKNKV